MIMGGHIWTLEILNWILGSNQGWLLSSIGRASFVLNWCCVIYAIWLVLVWSLQREHRLVCHLLTALTIHRLVHIALIMLLVVNSWRHFKRSGTTFSRQLSPILVGLGNIHRRWQIFVENSRTIALLLIYHLIGLLIVLVYIVFAYDTLLNVETEAWGHVCVGVKAFARTGISHTSVSWSSIYSKSRPVNFRGSFEQNWWILEGWRLWGRRRITLMLFCRILFNLSIKKIPILFGHLERLAQFFFKFESNLFSFGQLFEFFVELLFSRSQLVNFVANFFFAPLHWLVIFPHFSLLSSQLDCLVIQKIFHGGSPFGIFLKHVANNWVQVFWVAHGDPRNFRCDDFIGESKVICRLKGGSQSCYLIQDAPKRPNVSFCVIICLLNLLGWHIIWRSDICMRILTFRRKYSA